MQEPATLVDAIVAAPEPPAEEVQKPKRSRTKKQPAEAQPVATAEAPAVDAAPAKPKRTTSPKPKPVKAEPAYTMPEAIGNVPKRRTTKKPKEETEDQKARGTRSGPF